MERGGGGGITVVGVQAQDGGAISHAADFLLPQLRNNIEII